MAEISISSKLISLNNFISKNLIQNRIKKMIIIKLEKSKMSKSIRLLVTPNMLLLKMKRKKKTREISLSNIVYKIRNTKPTI